MRREEQHTSITAAVGSTSLALQVRPREIRSRGQAGGPRRRMGLRHWLGLSELTPREAAPYDLMPGATLDQVRKLIAEQAHGEVMQLRPGQRLVIEHPRAAPGGPMFTVSVE